ncbi:hypothetical protein MTO96_045819 [Rhipicephalus appendiculatus]
MWCFGSSDSDSSGSGDSFRPDRSIAVDESEPLVHGSSTSHSFPQFVIYGLLIFMVGVVICAAVLVLWKGTDFELRDGSMEVIIFILSCVAIASVVGLVFYVYVRCRGDYAESEGSSE